MCCHGNKTKPEENKNAWKDHGVPVRRVRSSVARSYSSFCAYLSPQSHGNSMLFKKCLNLRSNWWWGGGGNDRFLLEGDIEEGQIGGTEKRKQASQSDKRKLMESDSDRREGKVSDIRVPVALNTLEKERAGSRVLILAVGWLPLHPACWPFSYNF